MSRSSPRRPKAKGLPGSEANPWKVGENVTAHIKDRVLYQKGTGAMDDFASAAEVPWAAVADQVMAVTAEDGVTKIGKNAWADLADAVTINGTALSVIGFAAPGLASGEPVIPEGKVLVSKEEMPVVPVWQHPQRARRPLSQG